MAKSTSISYEMIDGVLRHYTEPTTNADHLRLVGAFVSRTWLTPAQEALLYYIHPHTDSKLSMILSAISHNLPRFQRVKFLHQKRDLSALVCSVNHCVNSEAHEYEEDTILRLLPVVCPNVEQVE
jgi:hypothetical protein